MSRSVLEHGGVKLSDTDAPRSFMFLEAFVLCELRATLLSVAVSQLAADFVANPKSKVSLSASLRQNLSTEIDDWLASDEKLFGMSAGLR